MPKPLKPSVSVFLNVPYDPKFEKLFLAYISGIAAFGFLPRVTLEIPTSSRRLDRILGLIGTCRYSIHDLSRVELDRKHPRTPRFNMPFELGLTVAHESSLKVKKHGWFVCESQPLRLAKSLSDLNGTDPFIHEAKIAGVFRELCNMFWTPRRRPSIQQIWIIYRAIRKRLPVVMHKAGSKTIYTARVFKDITLIANDIADSTVH